MKKFSALIPSSIGDVIACKSHLDAVKDQFSEIRINLNKSHVNSDKLEPQEFNKFIDDMGYLFFSDPPYVYDPNLESMFRAQYHILSDNNFAPQKPSQPQYLNQGKSLKINCPYIVITTKIRHLLKKNYYEKYESKLINTLNALSKKYAIILMGEKEMEISNEYKTQTDEIFVIYNSLKKSFKNNRVIDYTIPFAGKSTPNLKKIQQDCLIMNEAKAVITLGIGGNFVMALGCECNLISFREDGEYIADQLFTNKTYPHTFITKDFEKFINQLENLMI